MIQGKDIERLVELLKRRRVSLFHACQFLDFQSYFSLGAIPSRAYLEKKVQPFTLFVTDEDDHTKDVWDKVFMNFSDFGKTFSNGHDAVPNTYGPILLQIDPAILREAIDIAICVQPVGSSNFNRKKCALSSVEAVDKLFVHPADVGYPLSTWIKFKKTLSQEYKSKVCDPDISCTVRDESFH